MKKMINVDILENFVRSVIIKLKIVICIITIKMF
jgi:hypothetical protein